MHGSLNKISIVKHFNFTDMTFLVFNIFQIFEGNTFVQWNYTWQQGFQKQRILNSEQTFAYSIYC